MMPADPERLSRYPCFDALTTEGRQAVAEIAREECYYGNKVLFREGEPGSKLYLLASGGVEILYHISEDGPARVDAVGAGDILGCSSLIEPHIHSSTARCITEIETLVVDAPALRKVMEDDCPIGYAIQKAIIRRLLDRITNLRLGL
jgi:CRP/FNR family cyclic AMP-dependent transcriptional regulator